MKKIQRLGIYLHIPFCVRKCRYCDFLSFPAREDEIERYVRALCQEIRAGIPAVRAEASKNTVSFVVSSIFFGGGTPSLLTGEQIERLITELHQAYVVAEDAEITMEANPGTLTLTSLRAYRLAGINRLSLGLQSAQDNELKCLGRIHTWEEFLDNFKAARCAGFENINVDLMSALPGQTLISWEDTLKKVLVLEPEHLSAYSLIIEEGTPFYRIYGEEGRNEPCGMDGHQSCQYPQLPDEETERQMYENTEESLNQAGLYRYEISNYARPGYECRHNCAYWQRIPYLGLGLGASSFLEETRWRNQNDFRTYIKIWENTNLHRELLTSVRMPARTDIEPLSRKEQMAETLFLGLRMVEGIREEDFYQKFGQPLEHVYGKVLEKQERLGLIEWKNNCLRLTRYGIDVSNQVFCEYL